MDDMREVDTSARVLVAIVARLRDFAAVREEGWYRIPVARAPHALHAEYLAFYQTAAFGAERWAVRYYAAVRAVTIATRAQLLPDEAAHPRAAARYYRFALAAVQQLPLSLPSRRLRRISFIPTTFGQLLTARDVAELWRAPASSCPGWESVWGAGVNRRV
ncbi:MAG TPA: hypothetical protein PKK78_12405 [Kouleothrix sp.]|nr:hypothetical protein [Kouleothrix sp.]